MKDKEKNFNLSDFVLNLLNGFIKRISWNVVFNAKKQVDEIVFKIKSGFVVMIFLFLGIIFILVGVTAYLNAALNLFPGDGYLIIGLISVLLGIFTALITKYLRK
ncbi:MAG: hypothetical protein U5L10_02365 [Candidatus Moranbacteria bacterium]|nr:hypothetical protein [Candidatus Moranbacteria bacterium]